jgi:hypothetical protein
MSKYADNGILSKLMEKAKAKIGEIPEEAFVITGIWHIEYVINLTRNINAPVLNLGYVVIQTDEQGCSYYEKTQEDPGINEKLIGKNIFNISTTSKCLEIAGLDAVYAHLIGTPSKTYQIDGTNFDKAVSRAKIVVQESLSVLKKSKPKKDGKFSILNVGVVEQFLEIMSEQDDLTIKATDYYSGVVGHDYYGVPVLHGSKTNELIAEVDLAIITGLTLANGTLDEILRIAQKSNTKLAIFAETGAHFASEYCQMGIDVVISEPLPFYLSSSGRTNINIFHRTQ